MIILILGATGLLGSSLSSLFLQQNKNSILTPGRDEVDASNISQMVSYLSKTNPDIILNCAARVGGLYSQINHPASYLHDNILLLDSLYESARIASPNSHIVNFLSTCCFPVNVEYPISTDQLHNGPPHYTNGSYSYAKRMSDVYAQAYYREYGVNSTIFILGNLFGKNDHFHDPQNAHVIPSLIVKAHAAVQSGQSSFEIFGDGSPLREFLYADDAARCISLYLETLDRELEPELLLFSNQHEVSIYDLASLIATIASPNNQLRITTTTVATQGQLKKPSQNSAKLASLFSPEMYTPLDEALSKVYTAYADSVSFG
jgi:GDP-L-fucose synthase